MNKPTIYLSGKVTGRDFTEASLQFKIAEQHLHNKGYKVINPIDLVDDENCVWTDAMRICMIGLMKADEIYMLKGWHNSEGAQLEYYIALKLGLPVQYEK
jgi:Domain of unknown function (DUF4406)